MYVYAFLNHPANELKLPPGIEGNLQIIETDKIAAVAEAELISLEEIEKDDKHLMQAILIHDRILCELFNQMSILPLRFGTIFRSREDLVAHLNRRQSEYLEKLQQFEGKAEYLLKVVPLDAPVPSPDKEARGKSYLLAKKKRYQLVQTFQEQQSREWAAIKEAIANTYVNATIIDESQGTTYRIYLLVSKTEESILLENLERWQQDFSTWQLQLTEPLPPYHFV